MSSHIRCYGALHNATSSRETRLHCVVGSGSKADAGDGKIRPRRAKGRLKAFSSTKRSVPGAQAGTEI
jgi:hypothetical protein